MHIIVLFFILFLTLSMRTVILCSVLAVQHEQSADTQFNRHCDPHAGETKAADKNQCQADAHDPDTAKVHQTRYEGVSGAAQCTGGNDGHAKERFI